VSGGYTFTTLTGGPEEPMRIGVSFYPLDDAARIRVYSLGSDRPQLGIMHGDVEVLFLIPHGHVSEQDAGWPASWPTRPPPMPKRWNGCTPNA
jgi:hypothetical protein